MKNPEGLAALAGALSYAMGIEVPAQAEAASEALCRYLDEVLPGQKCTRLFLYNPDAIAQWLYENIPTCSRK